VAPRPLAEVRQLLVCVSLQVTISYRLGAAIGLLVLREKSCVCKEL
jgi:hypothetical protein